MLLISSVLASGQTASTLPSGLIEDWTTHHLVFSNPGTEDDAIKNGTHDHWLAVTSNPRYAMQQAKRGPLANEAKAEDIFESFFSPAPKPIPTKPKNPVARDWSFPLGTGYVAPNMYPAKYNFDLSGNTPSCTDFAVYGLDVVGSGTQANLVALTNLYTTAAGGGFCSGTGPTVSWAYNTSTISGKITTSPVLSGDGSKVAFIESTASAAVLHVLTWASGSGTVGAPATPSMQNLSLGAHGVTNSSPFYDYDNDTLWVGNDNGQLFQITPVFNGTPAFSTTGGWSATGVTVAAAGVKMTGPTPDTGFNYLLVGGSDGNLYQVKISAAGTQTHIAIGSGTADGGGIVDTPVVDGTTETVLAFAAANVAGVGNATANKTAVAVQAAVPGLGSVQVATIGQGSLGSTTGITAVAGAFDNAYYIWNGGSGANSGHFFEIGTASATTEPTLYQIPYSGVSSITIANNGSGYTTPTLTLTVGTGAGGVAVTGGVDNVTMGNTGPYSTVPTGVTFTGSNTTPASGTLHFGIGTLSSTTGSGYTSIPAINLTGGTVGTGVGSATAYLGVVSYSFTGSTTATTNNATNGAVPTVTVSGPTGSGNPLTTATANANYVMSTLAVGTNKGTFCFNPGTTFTIGGGVSGTADTFQYTGFGTISTITLTKNGRLYTNASPPTQPSGVCNGTAPTFDWALALSTLTANVQGSGYTGTGTTVSFNNLSGTTQSGTATVTPSFGVTSVTIVPGDYTTVPSLSIAAAGGSGTNAVLTTAWKINSVAVSKPSGSGYSTAPTVGFTGGALATGGTAASATATLEATGASFTYGGGGYSSYTATITDSGGSGTGGTASVTANSGSVMTPGTSPTSLAFGAAGLQASPLTEFYTSGSTDLLFFAYGNASTASDLVSYTTALAASGTPYPVPEAIGGTSGIIVDNNGTGAQESSIYFSTLAEPPVATVADVARASNVATITTSAAHGFVVGDTVVVVVSTQTSFNTSGAVITAVPSTTTFQYANTGSALGTTSVTTGTRTATVSEYHAIKLTQTGLN